MQINQFSLPEVYKESADFRTFLKLFELALTPIQYDIENMIDLFDPLRCKAELLWMLGETMGYKYDERLCTAFNRLVLVYFMSMIRLRGSKDGVRLAAEVNLAQFDINKYGKEKPILFNRLENVSVPSNSVYVNSFVRFGYIELVYFSEQKPIDACLEYVRPVGMYLFQHEGVRMDAKNVISVDARLTDQKNLQMSIGATRVGHYTREDYATIQKGTPNPDYIVDETTRQGRAMHGMLFQVPYENHRRQGVWHRNSDWEGIKDEEIEPGYRALYSLQMCNNEHLVQALIPSISSSDRVSDDAMPAIFSLGHGPQKVNVTYPDGYIKPPYQDKPVYNLRYDRDTEEAIMSRGGSAPDVYTVDKEHSTSIVHPRPAVNPIMGQVGDTILLDKPDGADYDHRYVHRDEDKRYSLKDDEGTE